jgi:uncharacterized membrane protein
MIQSKKRKKELRKMSSADSQRYHLLDALRGLALVNMIAYHGLWDVVYLLGRTLPWYSGFPGFLWQQGICWTFILLSGFCYGMGHHPIRHGVILMGCGFFITLVTALVLPEGLIWWGVLSLLGASSLVLAGLEPLLKKIPPALGLLLSGGLFALTRWVNRGFLGVSGGWMLPLPRSWYQNLFTAFWGFPSDSFFSSDYFSFFPWFFLFCTGWFLFRLLNQPMKQWKILRQRIPLLSWMGQHSLLIYLLHQPVLYGLLVALPALLQNGK